MKKCNSCKKEKPLSQFRRDKRLKDGHQGRCKVCVSAKIKADYKNKYKQKTRDRLKSYKLRNKEMKAEYLLNKVCACCEENDPIVFEFHHLNSEKKENTISSMVTNGTKWESILKEIKKCVVVCANCHRKIHHAGLKIPK